MNNYTGYQDKYTSPDGRVVLYLWDCMELLEQTPERGYELAVVDPPYGIDVTGMTMGSRKNIAPNPDKSWDTHIPCGKYFQRLFSSACDQIIWGGNYFNLPPSPSWLIWDKGESMYGRSFSEGEMAWCSGNQRLRFYKKNPLSLVRIHPTQKPVDLYRWILTNYAKPEQTILDTHLGSGSSAIAAHWYGCRFVGCELDEGYYYASIKRFESETAQADVFTPAIKPTGAEQVPLTLED